MNGCSVMVAEPDQGVRQCFCSALAEEQSITVRWQASDGLEALHLAKQHSPHVAVLGATLPRMDGNETASCLRQIQPNVRILIVGLYESGREAAIASGADEYVVRDCGCAHIREAVKRLAGAAAGAPKSEGEAQ